MTTASMIKMVAARPGLLKKSLVFLLFFVVESMAFVIIPLWGTLPKATLRIAQAALLAILLAAALLLRRSASGRPYWPVFYTFFAGGLAVLVSNLLSGSLVTLLGAAEPPTTPRDAGIADFSQSVLRVVTILALMAVASTDWRSMYLQKGRLGLSLAIGIPVSS